MKATSKQEFFELLGSELERIGIEDTNDIFADFEEHFTDGAIQGIPENETAERLGDIKEIARSYLNLESSRINSIMARDVERRKVSLTKPGRDVPADLSLIGSGTARDAANSDNIREYTPEHFSSEIYPQPQNVTPSYGASGTSASGADTKGGSGTDTGSGTGADTGAGTGETANTSSQSASNGGANKSVADAFADAGKAAADAAKLTGQVVADAFRQRGAEVKDAMENAGKTAADAIKAAGHSAAEAVRSATRSKPKRAKAVSDGVPQPSDTYRENMDGAGVVSGAGAGSRAAELPHQYTKSKGSGGYKIISFSELTPHLNVGKLVLAILLDIFLWSWVVPVVIALFCSIAFGGVIGSAIKAFTALFGVEYGMYHFISRILLCLGFAWLASVFVCLSTFVVRLFIKLIKFIINLHIKAVYDL